MGMHRRIGLPKGCLNTKLHAVVDRIGLPQILLLTEGQMNNHNGAKLMLGSQPSAAEMIDDMGYDGDECRNALASNGIDACILPRKTAIPCLPIARRSINSATRSSACSESSKIGAVLLHDTTNAPTHTSPPSASPHPSSSISTMSPEPNNSDLMKLNFQVLH